MSRYKQKMIDLQKTVSFLGLAPGRKPYAGLSNIYKNKDNPIQD